MKVELLRTGLKLVAQTVQDIAFLEDTLHLKLDKDLLILQRQNNNKFSKEAYSFSLTTVTANDLTKDYNKMDKTFELQLNSASDELEVKKFLASRLPGARLVSKVPPAPEVVEESVFEFGRLED